MDNKELIEELEHILKYGKPVDVFGTPCITPLNVFEAYICEKSLKELKNVWLMREALELNSQWLGSCLKCKDWVWDGDQRELAEDALNEAETILKTAKRPYNPRTPITLKHML